MKKSSLLFVLLLIALALTALCGCGKGGDDPVSSTDLSPVVSDDPNSTVIKDQDVSKLETQVDESLDGDWYISNTDLYGTETPGYCQLSFAEDGSYTQLITETIEGDKTAAGTWTIATGQLTLISEDRNVSYDYEVSEDQLILSSGNAALTFTHVMPQ